MIFNDAASKKRTTLTHSAHIDVVPSSQEMGKLIVDYLISEGYREVSLCWEELCEPVAAFGLWLEIIGSIL